MAGIKEVAKRAGVSISTVSNVLNNSKFVSPDLQIKVEKAVQELSYKPNPAARSMKKKETGMIGIITADMCGLFYPYLVKGICSVANEKGYEILISDTKGLNGEAGALEREYDKFKNMVTNCVDGIIFASVVPVNSAESYAEKLLDLAEHDKHIPLVSIERDFSKFGIDSVYFDGCEGAKAAVEHLLDCGCKKIGHITGPLFMSMAYDRTVGYKESMKEAGLEVDKNRMIAEGDYSHQSGYAAMKELLISMPEIDGVFCSNDQMAVGALKALLEVHKKVPEEIKIIGYDDVFISSMVEPELSTIHIRKKHAGIETAKILFDKIENPQVQTPPIGLKMESRLVVRKSTMLDASGDWILAEW